MRERILVVVVAFLIAVLPSAGVLLLFWIVIKALLEADRRERAAEARFDAQRRADKDGRSPGAGDIPERGAGGRA